MISEYSTRLVAQDRPPDLAARYAVKEILRLRRSAAQQPENIATIAIYACDSLDQTNKAV